MGTAIAGFKTTLDVSGDALAFSALELASVAGNLWEVGSSNDAKSVWDPGTALTVEVSVDGGGTYSTLTASDYAATYLSGRVDISTYGAAGSVTNLRVSGDYLPRYTEANAYSTDVELSFNALDSTTFGDADMARVRGLGDITLSVSTLDFARTPIDGSGGSEDELIQVLGEGRVVVVSVQLNEDTERYIRAFTKLESVSISSSVDGRVEGELSFVGHQAVGAGQSHTIFTRGTA